MQLLQTLMMMCVRTELLDASMTVAEALRLESTATTTATTTTTSARPAQTEMPQRQFSDFALTGHLQRPSLRLVYAPYRLTVSFRHIPGVPELFHCASFVSFESTVADTLEAVVDEFAVRTIAVHGAKSAKIDYCLERLGHNRDDDDGGAGSVQDPAALVLDLISAATAHGDELLRLRMTISPAWLARIGTVAAAAFSAGEGRRAPVFARQTSSSPSKAAAWRPSSLFGGLWANDGSTTTSPTKKHDKDASDSTVKASTDDDEPRTPTDSASTVSKRFSVALDWFSAAGGGGGGGAEAIPPQSARSSVVSAPIALSWQPTDDGVAAPKEVVAGSDEDLDQGIENMIVRHAIGTITSSKR